MTTKFKSGEEFVSSLVSKYCQKPVVSTSISIGTYYKKANSIFNQAIEYVKQKNNLRAYIELMKYSQLIIEISKHNQYNLKKFESDKNINKKRLNNTIIKLEELKPKLIKTYNDKLKKEKQQKELQNQQAMETKQKQETMQKEPVSKEQSTINKQTNKQENKQQEITASYPKLHIDENDDNPWSDSQNQSYPTLQKDIISDKGTPTSTKSYPTLESSISFKSLKLNTTPKLKTTGLSASNKQQQIISKPQQQLYNTQQQTYNSQQIYNVQQPQQPQSYQYIQPHTSQIYGQTHQYMQQPIPIPIPIPVPQTQYSAPLLVPQSDENNNEMEEMKAKMIAMEQELNEMKEKTETTIITWKWKDNDGIWKPYDENITNKIEELKTGEHYFIFGANNKQYKIIKISETKAEQINVDTNFSRHVKQIKQLTSKNNEIEYPEWWNMSDNISYGEVKLFELDLSMSPGSDILFLFQQTLPNIPIVKIQSIQNQMLFDKYWNARKQLIKLIGEENLNERTLFHGTKQLNVMDIIQKEGFRKEYTTVAKYGEGSYFARDSSYSIFYSSEDKVTKCFKMFACRVICGESHVGNDSYSLKSWPKKNGGIGLIYDTLVDSKMNPSIFVIHDDVRAYPMFVITFNADID